jgi:hypothetical protein
MEKPYLIQRCLLRKQQGQKPGFDSKFQLDYMGSAEFEFGSVPKSLKNFTKNLESLKIFQAGVMDYKGQGLWVVCIPEVWEKYKEYIPLLVSGNIRLKEVSYLPEATLGKDFRGKPLDPCYNKADLWWDIENNVMMAYGKDVIKLAMKAIQEVREAKKAQDAKDWL